MQAGFVADLQSVSNGETAYERHTGREYHGKICWFGEVCMGYLKPSA